MGQGNVIQKNGVEYLQIVKLITKVKIAYGHIEMDDTEQPVAGNKYNKFLNKEGLFEKVFSFILQYNFKAS